MRYEVYLDSYFWLNAGLNCVTLYLTGKLMNHNISYIRLCAGAAAGALLSCIGLIAPLAGMIRLTVWPLLCATAAVRLAFMLHRVRHLCYGALFFYGAGFLLNGIVLWARQLIYQVTGRTISPILFPAVILLGSVGIGSLCKRLHQMSRQNSYAVRMMENGRDITIQALLDTGNSLREPFSKKPVCIVEKSVLEQIADTAYRQENPQKCSVIPYHSIGKRHGILEGFRISRMQIDIGKQNISLQDVIVAVSEEEITGGGSYQMILHPSMISQEEENT